MRASVPLLFAYTLLGSACYYELEPIEGLDQGVPDLGVDFAGLDGDNLDGPRCANGAPAAHAGELSEDPIDRWGAEPTDPLNVASPTASVVLDPARVAAGAASLRFDTNNGQAGLFFPKTRDASYDLRPYLYLSFSVTADDSSPANDPGWQGAQPHVLLVTDTNDYYEYVPDEARLPRTPGAFVPMTVPLAGGMGWSRNKLGAADLGHVKYFALLFDSWGAGFTVWVDDLRFGPADFVDCPQ